MMLTDVTVRRIGRSDPVMVIRELTRSEADRIMANLRLEPGQVAGRREYYPWETW